MPIENKQDLLLKSLKDYYKNSSCLKKLVNVLGKSSHISLRVIDYLCTNYGKHNDIVYYVGQKKTPFNLYLDYRAQLKAYSKLQFDPFKRHNRINIQVPTNVIKSGKLETTVAQLNFFKWAIDNKIIEFLEDPKNLKKIESNMNQNQGKLTVADKTKSVFRSSTKRHNLTVTVTFQ
jgi:hypothetical protein